MNNVIQLVTLPTSLTQIMKYHPDSQVVQFLDGNIGIRTGRGRLLAIEDNKRIYFNSNDEYRNSITLSYSDWVSVRNLKFSAA